MGRDRDALAELLRAAGPRETAPAERALRIEAAVRPEWREAVQKRLRRRRAGMIAASCLTSAALIALVLHTHPGQARPHSAAAALPLPRPAQTVRVGTPQSTGAYFRANDEDRPPDRGIPRHVLASYSWDTR